MTILLLGFIVTCFDLNKSVHQALQILIIETSDLCVRLVNMWPSHDSSGKAGKLSKRGLIDCVVWPLLHPT